MNTRGPREISVATIHRNTIFRISRNVPAIFNSPTIQYGVYNIYPVTDIRHLPQPSAVCTRQEAQVETIVTTNRRRSALSSTEDLLYIVFVF